MTKRCEPSEDLRGADGWYWVQSHGGFDPFPAHWHAAPHTGREPLWTSSRHVAGAAPARAADEWGWRCLGPCATPAEVDALRAGCVSLQETICNIADNLTLLGVERDTLRARVVELEATLRDARMQLEYMDERSPSGTTPAMIARIGAALEGAKP